ncbi:unnamed protein product, partial [Candidula unifasciata]
LYIITAKVGSYTWTVKRRYSEFYQLHEKLVASYKLDKSLLPPKKIFGNQTESFIRKRQLELEIYLQTILLFLAQHIPSCLAYFLDFDKYEIHGITQAMAEDLYSRGECLLQSRDKYEVSTLQLHSLTERLKLPEPTCDSGDVKKDLGHILDFITRAKHLKVVCSKKTVGLSNILMYKLPFDLTLFKSLQTLEICGCNFRIVSGLESVKQTVTKFEVHQSSSSMKEIFLRDAPHWRADDGALIVDYWTLVNKVNFSHNSFSEIHDSIQLMPNIEKLDLSHNRIESIQNLHWLSQLTHIDLSHNNIYHADWLHTKLGNVQCVRLAHNHLESLHGFAKLFSLKTLDISHNKILLIDEIKYVTQLPCIEELNLEGNPVTSSLDYRTKTLEMFGERVTEVVLDNKCPDQKELDTVAVLQALKKAKDAKIMTKAYPKKNTSSLSLSDMYCESLSSSTSDHPDDKGSPASFVPSGKYNAGLRDSTPEAHLIDQFVGSSSSLAVSHQAAWSVKSDNPRQVLLLKMTFSVTDLPTVTDTSFLVWLNKHLFSHREEIQYGSSERSQQEKEAIIDIVWCYAEQLSKPGILFPCCAVLTKKRLFIEKLTGLNASFPNVPELRPCCMMSLQNIQQLVLGPCHAFLRLEEAFVGKSGVFTLFCFEIQGLKMFFNKLFKSCCNLDVINSYSFIDLTVRSDLLRIIALKEEQSSGVSSDRLVSAALVQLKDSSVFNLLVLSENKVYCLDLDCVHWPPASYETSPEAAIRFNVLHEFSIKDKIRNISISPGEGLIHPNRDRIPNAATDVQFEHYELSLDVAFSLDKSAGFSVSSSSQYEGVLEDCKQHSGIIRYHFPSPPCRDLFLERLNNMRAELAHRMSPNLREEPEGGNEQLSPCDRNVFVPDSSPSLKSRIISVRDGSVSPLLKTAYKGTAVEASVKNMGNLWEAKQDPCAPHSGSRSDGKLISKESGASPGGESWLSKDDSHQARICQPHSESSSSACCDSSPREDLSVSPMSNFSRASISPVIGQTQEVSKPVCYPDANRFAQHFTTAETHSLPTSFDWKQYYFQNRPYFESDTKLELKDDLGETSSNNTSTQLQVHSHTSSSFLEVIESSCEFDPGHNVETEHELYLKSCLKSYDLIYPLSSKLKPLCLMNGKELNKFFHASVVPKVSANNLSLPSEELQFVLWSVVVPYTNPKQEITTLVMLSTLGIYLISDTSPQVAHQSRPSWMTHSRNSSDSAITAKSGKSIAARKMVQPYFVFRYKDLLQVNIGLFDQCVRLTGSNENSVFTLATRSSVTTEKFIEKLKHVLSIAAISPVVEKSRSDTEGDFYRSSHQYMKATFDGIVYTHPSQVKFVYPGEDAVQDILYLVNERTYKRRKASPRVESASKLWFYLQCYLLPSDDSPVADRSQPRSVIITANSFCLAEEDVVTYPLPDFVRGVPEHPCHEIVECRQIDNLKRITLFHSHPHLVCLTFVDETDGIVVDVSMQHFGKLAAGKEKQHMCPEVTYRLYVQNMKERDKMIQVLDILWKGLVTQIGRILDIIKI